MLKALVQRFCYTTDINQQMSATTGPQVTNGVVLHFTCRQSREHSLHSCWSCARQPCVPAAVPYTVNEEKELPYMVTALYGR